MANESSRTRSGAFNPYSTGKVIAGEHSSGFKGGNGRNDGLFRRFLRNGRATAARLRNKTDGLLHACSFFCLASPAGIIGAAEFVSFFFRIMTPTPPDPLATQHDSFPDPHAQAPEDPTFQLREENRALRELLAAQAQAALPSRKPGLLRRLGWLLISAPGAALVGARRLLRRESSRPISGKRLGRATLTVLYTLAIYGALVLLVVSWTSPNTPRSGSTAAGPVRMPLAPLPAIEAAPESVPSDPVPATLEQAPAPSETAPATAPPDSAPVPVVAPEHAPGQPQSATPAHQEHATAPRPVEQTSEAPASGPQPTLRVTEIPAQDPLAWVGGLQSELARCATLGFFERPDCAWAARKQYCEPHRAWGTIKECPNRP